MLMIVALIASSVVCLADGARVFEQSNIKFPGISHTEEIFDWLARWELARCLTILKRYDEAIADYRVVLKEKPDLHKARLELAQVLVWHERRTEAGVLLAEIHLLGCRAAKRRILIVSASHLPYVGNT